MRYDNEQLHVHKLHMSQHNILCQQTVIQNQNTINDRLCVIRKFQWFSIIC